MHIIYFSFPLLFLVSFTNKVCLYRFQGRFNIRQPFFLDFLFLYQKLELSLLKVVHALIYNLLPNPGIKTRSFLNRSFPVGMSLVAVFFHHAAQTAKEIKTMQLGLGLVLLQYAKQVCSCLYSLWKSTITETV